MAGRKMCKNRTAGSQRGQKWPPEVKAAVLMDMLGNSNICAVAREHGVPESTIRTWMAKEAQSGDTFAEARKKAARDIATVAAEGALRTVAAMRRRVKESARNEEICAAVNAELDEGTRAASWRVGKHAHTAADRERAAEETALVVYGSTGSRAEPLTEAEKTAALEMLERHKPMSDTDLARFATVLDSIARQGGAAVAAEAPADGRAVVMLAERPEENADVAAVVLQ